MITDKLNIFRSAIFAGILIGIAGLGFLISKSIGMFLFIFGLAAVVSYGVKFLKDYKNIPSFWCMVYFSATQNTLTIGAEFPESWKQTALPFSTANSLPLPPTRDRSSWRAWERIIKIEIFRQRYEW